jgi:hypothetical protein
MATPLTASIKQTTFSLAMRPEVRRSSAQDMATLTPFFQSTQLAAWPWQPQGHATRLVRQFRSPAACRMGSPMREERRPAYSLSGRHRRTIRHMRPMLFRLLTGLSLFLAVATATLWVLSPWRFDRVDRYHATLTNTDGSSCSDSQLMLMSFAGRVQLALTATDVTSSKAGSYSGWIAHNGWSYQEYATQDCGPPRQGPMGFYCATGPSAGLSRSGFNLFLQFPHWFPLGLFSILPALQAIRWNRARRHRHAAGPGGFPCPNCGYDLRATRDRCPECGTVPTTPGTA